MLVQQWLERSGARRLSNFRHRIRLSLSARERKEWEQGMKCVRRKLAGIRLEEEVRRKLAG